MDISTLKQKALPHGLAILIFLLLTVIFYSPIIFQDKSLNQNDVSQGVAAGSEATEFRKETGEEALWTNSMFSGMPTYLINIHWSGATILTLAEKILSVGLPLSAKETFLSLVSFYILLIVFGVRPSLAIAGAIAYGFSTFFIISIEAGHLWKVRAIAFAPLVIAGVHLTYLKKYWLGFALTALALGLEINSNHLQITYYLFLNLVIYGIAQLIYAAKNKELPSFAISSGLIVLASLLAIGANFGKLWSTYEYGKYSIRGTSELTSNASESSGLDRDYTFNWSSGKAESFTYIVPNFYGGASGLYKGKDSDLEKVLTQNNVPPDQIQQYTRGLLGYWGPQPFVSGPVYAGAIICFLFVLGVLVADNRYKGWLIAATILALILSWGKNFAAFNYFIFDTLPMYNKFRAVSMTVVIAMTAMPLLGFLGLEKLIQNKDKKEITKKLLIPFGITGGLAILIALVAYVPTLEGEFPDWVRNAVTSSRKSIIRMDALRSFFFITTTCVAIYFFIKGKIKSIGFAAIIITLLVLDILGVDYRYVNSESYVSARKNSFLTEQPADKVILSDKSLSYRVCNFQDPFNEARTSTFHKSIGGYHGAKLGRYNDFIAAHLATEMQDIMSSGRITPSNTQLLSMLNTKYFLVGTTAESVIQNPNALGNAWFVKSLIEVKTADEELAAVGNFNPKSEVILNTAKFEKPIFQYDSAATISLASYAPNKLVYNTKSAVDGYVVFSEIYYPKGWKAFIDGNASTIDQVNYILRGMKITAGEHTIEFRFEPDAYFIGNKISWASSILLLMVIAGAVVVSFKKEKNATE